MATVSVASIIARAQAAADMYDDFISESTWVAWVNAEHKKLWIRLARSGYPINIQDESISANGSAEYNITEPVAIVGVLGVNSSGAYYRIPVKHPFEQKYVGALKTGTPKECYIRHANSSGQIQVRFYPAPTEGTFFVQVIPKPDDLTVSDNIRLPNGWEERIVLGIARRALGKEETTNPAIEREIAEIDNTIDNNIHSYHLVENPTVRDISEMDPVYTNWYYV